MKSDMRLVVLWMMGTLAAFLVLAVAIRALVPALSVFEILALRNLGGIVILGVWALLRARGHFGAPSRDGITAPRPLWLHTTRNVFHFAGQALWTTGLTLLPIATVFALEFTAPAWTVVLAVLFLGERLTAGRVGAVVLGFAGVLVILRPGMAAFDPAGLIVLAAAAMFGVQLITTKRLTGSNTVLNILFWMNIMQLPMYLVAQGLTGRAPLILPHLTLAMVPALIALCSCGLLAHVCLTNAFRHGDAIVVVPIDFLRIPLITLVGVLLYGEAFDPMVLLGSAVTAAGILWNIRSESRGK
ncbi:MAG: DMT family transporter [Alphaproteobacteria bacterium]|nr:DMT family transporter [Alphaproteobacteria bacterium]